VQETHPPSRVQTRKRFKVWKILLSIFLVLLLSVVFLVARTGLVPGLSHVVGADKPRDLGVTATAADYDRVVQEVGFLFKQAPAAGGSAPAAPAGPQPIDREFTEAELTALLAHHAVGGSPVREPQVRIQADETVEVSLLISKKALPAELTQHLPRGTPDELPLYVKGHLNVSGPSAVKLEIERLEVGRVGLPLSLLGPDGKAGLTDVINEQLRATPGLVLEDLIFRDGAVMIKGTYQP
jgi:hypothetical protein